ncbi:FecR domain-containing protein [Diaphorobacter aerolatus]|uniref:FecR domain-containing protein n=1 Tax=Diaphorobacter aerolatus TaxID=1288495 RepID=A0A7H0GNE4_9BURK|nr:FecR domain-containing protein [Diaphorobacter aerolatus]QNP49810.1 FecR domain-containing protein [Diaphorobacter aerolatus]
MLALASPEGHFEHRIRQGDTLERLATEYYGDYKLWPELQQYNQVVDPRRLRPGAVLRIPVRLLSLQTAEVSFVEGQASVATKPGAEHTELKPGQKLTEGAEIKVAPDSFVTVKLADGSLIRIQANSDVRLKQLRRTGRAGSLQSVLEMHKGAVNATVGTEPDPSRKFEVRTPRATTSVRGTTFDVSLTEGGDALSTVTHGKVSVQGGSDRKNVARLTEGQGIAVSGEGQLGQTRNLLSPPDLSRIPETMEDSNFLSFQIEPVQQASAYQVQVARDESMNEVLRSGTFPSGQVRLKIVDDGSYYVVARAMDAQQLPGMPAKRKLRVKTQPPPPLYQQPAPGGTTSRTSGMLKCTPVSGVQKYRIQVADSAAGFDAPLLLDLNDSEDCSAQLASLPVGSYQWRAASIRQLSNGSPDQGPFSQPQAFKLANDPSAPDLSAMDSAEDLPGLHLRWPGEAGQIYRLQVSATEDFATLLADETLDTPVWNASGIRPGNYYVRIRTHDNSTGLDSPFSTARQVRAAAEIQSGFGLPLTSSDGEPLTRK